MHIVDNISAKALSIGSVRLPCTPRPISARPLPRGPHMGNSINRGAISGQEIGPRRRESATSPAPPTPQYQCWRDPYSHRKGAKTINIGIGGWGVRIYAPYRHTKFLSGIGRFWLPYLWNIPYWAPLRSRSNMLSDCSRRPLEAAPRWTGPE